MLISFMAMQKQAQDFVAQHRTKPPHQNRLGLPVGSAVDAPQDDTQVSESFPHQACLACQSPQAPYLVLHTASYITWTFCAQALHHIASKTFVLQNVADLQLLTLGAFAVASVASSAVLANL